MHRWVFLLGAAAVLAAPAPAVARSTLSESDGTYRIVSDADPLELDLDWFLRVPGNIDLASPQAFTNQTTRCHDTSGGAATGFNCTPAVGQAEVTGSPGDDSISASCGGGRPTTTNTSITAGSGDDEVTTSCSASIDLGPGSDALSVRIGRSVVHGGDGPDDIGGGVFADQLFGDAGNDRIRGSNANDVLEGGEGNDSLDGGILDDTLRGGPGRDLLIGGAHTDVLDGGDGRDTVSYEDRDGSASLTISLNGAADDGASGENDRIVASVENVIGSPGEDRITGDGGPNEIEGDAGGDVINPGAGTDFVDAGPGNDRVEALDGVSDRVTCGAGDDFAIVDAFDITEGCEGLQVSRGLMRDVDDDGVAVPADCADTDPAIRPGRPDVPDNGIDEDCDGADAVDLDRDDDGAARPTDCNDGDARVRPGLPDRPGNGVDENCEGGDAPYPRILTPVLSSFVAYEHVTRVTSLRVMDVPAGATIELRCSGGRSGGCFRGVLRQTASQAVSVVNLTKRLRRQRFKARAVLEVRVTVDDTIGKVVRYTMRENRTTPASQTLCVKPGASPQRRC